MSQACRRFCSIHAGSSFWRDSSSTALLESPLGRALGIDGHPILLVRGPEPLVTFVFEFESQAGICFIHHCDFRLEQGHLENLGALLFAAGEPIIDRAVDETVIYFEQAHLFLQQLAELARGNAPALS